MGDKVLQVAEQFLLMDLRTCVTTDTTSSVVIEREPLLPHKGNLPYQNARIALRLRIFPTVSCNSSVYPLLKTLVILTHLPPWEGDSVTERLVSYGQASFFTEHEQASPVTHPAAPSVLQTVICVDEEPIDSGAFPTGKNSRTKRRER